MQRYCLALDLKNDPVLIEKYKAYHAQGGVWPEILESIKSAGITDMQIFCTGNRLFMIMEVSASFDSTQKAKADAENPKVQEWETLMDQFQLPLPWAKEGQKWVPMDQIFGLKN
ncbi:L-rhamnose mutarotase [Reichenbachiella carrageenanivorans]|uniref:L-rhamnose mutarotase n=1 Tax=Reichenbachiella carrageenanivorans TaxID=2979869 RepID=A0ABY6D5F3_9BACT|nr:L-rhamnose mutarotase [Reichenbachiella carrageenanivorans]UXX81392.1 L-rhamnose mutarotase [Reichenbachiella carrageenanivorans]